MTAGNVRDVAMHGHDLALSAAENYRAFAEDAEVWSEMRAPSRLAGGWTDP